MHHNRVYILVFMLVYRPYQTIGNFRSKTCCCIIVIKHLA